MMAPDNSNIPKDEIRDLILQAARSVFAKFGFRKTTVDEIARAARKGKSSIYYYFAGKEEIYTAVVSTETDMFRNQLLIALQKSKDPQDKLRAYVTTRMASFCQLITLYEANENEFLGNFEFIKKLRKKIDQEEIGIIRTILSEGKALKRFHIEDEKLAAIAIFTAIKGLDVPLPVHMGNNSPIEERMEGLLDILFYGLVVR
jgi:AcrR family transcriptional regulator